MKILINQKPQNIGTFPDGNSIWDDYKFQNEMLQKYIERQKKVESTGRGTDKKHRIEQYKIQVQLAEGRLIEFCKKHDITIKQ